MVDSGDSGAVVKSVVAIICWDLLGSNFPIFWVSFLWCQAMFCAVLEQSRRWAAILAVGTIDRPGGTRSERKLNVCMGRGSKENEFQGGEVYRYWHRTVEYLYCR